MHKTLSLDIILGIFLDQVSFIIQLEIPREYPEHSLIKNNITLYSQNSKTDQRSPRASGDQQRKVIYSTKRLSLAETAF